MPPQDSHHNNSSQTSPRRRNQSCSSQSNGTLSPTRHGYSKPQHQAKRNRYNGTCNTTRYNRRRNNRPFLKKRRGPNNHIALDCEMVGVGAGGYDSALARITLVDFYGCVILDTYVQPEESITDYRTFVSGITEEQLNDAPAYADVKRKVERILDGKILVGHGLHNDLKALGVDHPWHMTRDTAQFEYYMKVRDETSGVLLPRKLRDLASEFLQREIQVPGKAHSPVEDARAALDLYKAVLPHFDQAISYLMQICTDMEGQQRVDFVETTEQ